jgi:uncharacterized protein
MTTITVRVIPRSAVTSVKVTTEGDPIIRVRSAPEAGRATKEAADALAEALGVPPSRVSLKKGARSRIKIFRIEGLSEAELSNRIMAL